MLRSNQWRRMNRMQEALVMVSTNAGQNVIRGRERREVAPNVLPASRSNPQGYGTRLVRLAPRQNPLMGNIMSNAETLNNAIRNRQNRMSPLTATFHDCIKHNEAKEASL
jgi:hypothetical protein